MPKARDLTKEVSDSLVANGLQRVGDGTWISSGGWEFRVRSLSFENPDPLPLLSIATEVSHKKEGAEWEPKIGCIVVGDDAAPLGIICAIMIPPKPNHEFVNLKVDVTKSPLFNHRDKKSMLLYSTKTQDTPEDDDPPDNKWLGDIQRIYRTKTRSVQVFSGDPMSASLDDFSTDPDSMSRLLRHIKDHHLEDVNPWAIVWSLWKHCRTIP